MIQITSIRNEKGNISTNSTVIKSIARDYYEHFYANKFYNLDEKGKFLQRHQVPKFTQ